MPLENYSQGKSLSHVNSSKATRDSSCLTGLHFHRDILWHCSVFLGRCKNNNLINKMWNAHLASFPKLLSGCLWLKNTNKFLQINEISWIISGHGFRVSFQPEQGCDLTHRMALQTLAPAQKRQQHDWLVQLQHTSNNFNLLWNHTLRKDNSARYTCTEHQLWRAF